MATLIETYACVPTTERSRGLLLSGDPDPNSNKIIYCNGRSVVMFDLDSPIHATVYREHQHQTTVARYSPNGEWVASADVSGTVRIWGARDEFVLKNEFQVLSGRIDDLQWSPDSEMIVVSGDGKAKSFIRAFMWDTGTSVGEFDGHSKRVVSCAFKPTKPFRIVTCGEDFRVNFYEGPPFKFKQSHRDHTNLVNCVRFSPDGSKFISVGSDKKALVYDAKTGERIGELSGEDGHKGSIYVVSWSPSGFQALTVSADKTAKVWEISADGKGVVKKTLIITLRGLVEDILVGCLWQNDYLVVVSLGGTIALFSAFDLEKQPTLISGHMKNINTLSILDRNPKVILSTSYEGLICKWIQGIGYKGKIDRKVSSPIMRFATGREEIVSCGHDDKVWRHSLVDDGSIEEDAFQGAAIAYIPSPAKDFSLALYSPQRRLVALDKKVVLFDDTNIVSTTVFGFTVTTVAVSPEGDEAVVGSEDGKLHVCSISNDILIKEAVLEKHRGPIIVICYSPDATMFASVDSNRETIVWDRSSREIKLNDMVYHTDHIKCLAWSPSSSMVATGSLDKCVIIYEVNKPPSSHMTIKEAHFGGVYGLVFINDYTIVSSGDDACIRVWRIAQQ